MILQATGMKTEIFDVRRLTPADETAVLRFTGGAGLSHAPGLRALLQQGAVLGDYAGGSELQAANALLPMWGDAPLSMALRAAGFAADGQGAVLTPPCLVPDYPMVRQYLAVAMAWAQERYTKYHLWAVLPGTAEELCAQYLACGFSLRALRLIDGPDPMLVFSARPLPPWEEPVRRVHFSDRRLPRLLEQGYAASEFGWDRQGMVLMLRPSEPQP
ncbi:MAG: hypothetical protein ACI4OL_03505 [Gemmiger sp.]